MEHAVKKPKQTNQKIYYIWQLCHDHTTDEDWSGGGLEQCWPQVLHYVRAVLIGIEEACMEVRAEFSFAKIDDHWWCLDGEFPCHSHTFLKIDAEWLQPLNLGIRWRL